MLGAGPAAVKETTLETIFADCAMAAGAAACKSQPALATTMGLRAKAMAMPVINSTRSVTVAATASGRNGSWAFSMVMMPS